jgi:tartrate/fumarate subfamily iron-sulfur-dependent hydro-lyase alpha chain
MISKELLTQLLYNLIVDAVCVLPDSTAEALEEACLRERNPLGKMHLTTSLEQMRSSREERIPLCSDTGYPVFYIRSGETVPVAGGIPSIEIAAAQAIRDTTKNGWLRRLIVDPLSWKNPGTNVGPDSPYFDYRFDPDFKDLEITFAPKGGGTELFLAPSYKAVLAANGIKGVKRFIFDTVAVFSEREGGTCSPNIVGIGLGGTSDLCMRLAKQAAMLRPIGDRHPEKRIAEMELELLSAFNETGIGPLGTGGDTTVLDVHIEYSMGRVNGIPVGIALQCPATRIGTLRIHGDGSFETRSWPEWFKRKRINGNSSS